ncbi:prepilin peptidase [Candidatus Saccharibacteria bacterium]|nr:prepilin peptidase [Candidatus Saccharibacteria bacterium]
MEIIVYLFAFIFGACLGSFLCCQARRLHLRQAKSHRKPSSQSAHKSTASRPSKLPRRSICLHCHRQLAWYDNIPLISWLVLRGKCRHCHRPIGLAEFLSELGTGAALVGVSTAFCQSLCGTSGLTIFGAFPPQDATVTLCTASPLNYIILAIIALLTILLIFLAIYDGLYGELPNFGLILAIILGLVVVILRVCTSLALSPFSPDLILYPLFATLILGGLYLLLYLLSHGRWVGDGDWLLATAIALILGHPILALVALFLANFLACFIMLPATRGNTRAKIHFGPFLVAAFVLVCSFSHYFIMIML